MASDRDIRRMHIEGWSTEAIADMLGHNINSVRGRISRADLQDRVVLARELADSQPTINKGLERQRAVLERADKRFHQWTDGLRQRGTTAIGVFAGDLHLPYTNWGAVLLLLRIVEHIQPDVFSALNDLFDFEGYGRWGDTRSPAERLWSDDISNPLSVARELHAALLRAAPYMELMQVQGNHDNWAFNHLRTVARTGFSEHGVADFMEELEKQGVTQFVNGENKKENIVKLSPGLKWVHGVSASANIRTVAKATQDACRGRARTDDEGVYYHTVSGHTHRDGEVPVNGVYHWNAGTLRTFDPTYTKFEPLWDTSIVINRFDPNSRYVTGQVVRFQERGGHLIARYDGVDFDAPLTP